jgi:hypothetical protein
VIVFDHDSRGRRDEAGDSSASAEMREASRIGLCIPRRGRLLREAHHDLPVGGER